MQQYTEGLYGKSSEKFIKLYINTTYVVLIYNMELTRTETKVLELFTSRILDRFTIREVARLIKKDLKIVHTSIKSLIEKGFLIKEEPNGLRLNYKNNIQSLSYIESIRKEGFEKKHPLIIRYADDIIIKSRSKFFSLIVFGSYAAGKETKRSDIDLLVIIPEYDESFERQLNSIISVSDKKFHANIISQESFREMISKRDQTNIVNETLNNHIILYGSEVYYSLLGERDVR